MTFILAAVPGIVIALFLWLTVKEPPRGLSDGVLREAGRARPVPGMFEVLRTLWQKRSFRHLTLAAALHSVVWYASSAFNNAFLQRSHQMSVAEAGYWIAMLSAIAGFGTFLGGFASDRLSVRFNDRRWYLWVPGIATLLCVPFQFLTFLSADRAVMLPSFVALMFMAAVFFGPSFAMTQALATLRMRSVATSLLLFVQTLIGNGLGPSVTGFISDRLAPSYPAELASLCPGHHRCHQHLGRAALCAQQAGPSGRTWRRRRSSRRRSVGPWCVVRLVPERALG